MLTKLINKPIQINSFLIELKLNISQIKNNLISEIEKGILQKDNMNFQTNVKGQMTSWSYFNDNLNFKNILKDSLKEIRNYVSLDQAYLVESWGIKISRGETTNFHDHSECIFSGILYLNDFDEPIIFPNYNLKIIPKEGTFMLFSGLLEHGTEPSNSDIIKYAIPFNFRSKKSWN